MLGVINHEGIELKLFMLKRLVSTSLKYSVVCYYIQVPLSHMGFELGVTI